jgi:S-adenosylmethionine decarboxylase
MTEPMPPSREPVRLQGFNNLTKVVSFNLYDFVVARTETERERYVRHLHERFNSGRITVILAEIARIIDAEVLSVSAQDYDPWGASAMLLMSDLGHTQARAQDGVAHDHKKSLAGSVGVHLTKSHLCAHTYPDVLDPRGICTFRMDIDIATCGTIVPLRALDFMLESFENDVVIIDYVVRGFTRDSEGKRIYIDHSLRSIQDFIDPAVLSQYVCEDLALPAQNIWQTKMLRTNLDPHDYFTAGTDPTASESRELFELMRREMVNIFYNRP